jgi:hypothetical protein
MGFANFASLHYFAKQGGNGDLSWLATNLMNARIEGHGAPFSRIERKRTRCDRCREKV